MVACLPIKGILHRWKNPLNLYEEFGKNGYWGQSIASIPENKRSFSILSQGTKTSIPNCKENNQFSKWQFAVSFHFKAVLQVSIYLFH